MKSEKQIKEALKDCRNAVQEFEDTKNYDNAMIHKGWVEALEYVLLDNLFVISDKEQSALNIIADAFLYDNFYRGNNGLFSYAEVIEWEQDENEADVLMVDIHFGQQDDCHNETFTSTISVLKDDLAGWINKKDSSRPPKTLPVFHQLNP